MWPVFKRIIDIIFSFLFLLILSPIMILIALLILIIDGRPIIFNQERVGVNWKPFNIYKFRSMNNNTSKSGIMVTAKGDARVTKIGYWLRRSKVDELPQLFNVLKGEMSIIGPRPEVYKYALLVKNDYNEILSMRPGITDFASIKFRNEELLLEFEKDKEAAYIEKILPQRVLLYKKYINETSFLTDIKIFMNTFIVVSRL